MALNYRRIWKGMNLVPKTTTESNIQGDLEVLSSNGKLHYYNGTSNSPVVTEAHPATLTDKTIVVSNNTITTAASGNLAATELNAALAELDGDITTVSGDLANHISDATDAHDASAISNVPAGTIAATDVQAAINELDGDIQGHITDAVDAHDASAISVIATGNLAATEVQAALVELQGDIDTINTTSLPAKVTGPASATDEAVARFDLTTGKLIQNSVVTITDAGVAAGLTGLTSSGTVSSTGTLAVNGALTEAITTDAAATGANATITNPATTLLRLTNASLSSVDMISSPVAGEVITIVNATGVDITINNDLGGTAANRILTGTKANLTLKDEASIVVKYDSSESRWMVIGGTGAGSGSAINYVLSSDGGSTTGWATYADAAGVVPVDGTGGSPNVTFAATTSSPLVGTSSFLFTKDAANRQGQGVSYDFTIDSGYQAQILRISFPYSASTDYLDTVSGNLINSDMQVFVYDVTNSVLISVIDQNIGATLQGQYVGSFQTSSNSTSYRLILHVASTNAAAYTLKLDNVVVGPQTLIKGAVDVYLGALTTTGSWSTNTTYTFDYWRRGDRLIADGVVSTSGAPTSANLNIDLPAGLSIDSTKTNTTSNANYFGMVSVNDSGATYYPGLVRGSNTATNVRLMYVNAASTIDNITQALPITFGANDSVYVRYEVPIAGWSSNLTLSEDGGNRKISFTGSRTLAGMNFGTNNTYQKVTFDTINEDSSAAFSSGTFTTPETGRYSFSSNIGITSTNVLNNQYGLSIYKNGSEIKRGIRIYPGAAAQAFSLSINSDLELVKGDTIELYLFGAGNNSVNVLTSNSTTPLFNFSGHKIASPQTLAGGEVVACAYYTNAAQAVVDSNVVIFEDLEFDTHNAYNAGIYTVPVSGYYEVSCTVSTANVVASLGNYLALRILGATNSRYGLQDICENTTGRVYKASITGTVKANKGDTIAIYFDESMPAVNLSATSTRNWLTITKVG